MALSDSKYKDSFITQDELDTLLKEAESLSLNDQTGRTETLSDDEVVSQDDIDAILGLSGWGQEEIKKESADNDLVTQDDIDALLGTMAPSKKKVIKDPDATDDDLTDLDLVTPEDIKRILQAEAASDENFFDKTTDDNEEDDSITDEDIRALISGSGINDALPRKDEGAGDVLVSQDDIDALLAGTAQTPKASASADDIDSLLKSSAGFDVTEVNAGEADDTETNLISQEDIDKLLMGKFQEPEEEEATLIDQEDIDRLLSSARPAAEDRQARGPEPDKLISQEDIDRLLQEDDKERENPDETISDQVILEKSDSPEDMDDVPGKPGKEKRKKEKTKIGLSFLRSRVFVGATVACLILVAGFVSFFVYRMSGRDEGAPAPVVAQSESRLQDKAVKTDEPLETLSVTMNDFVALSPSGTQGKTYISLALTFQISGITENPVKGYEPFFRNIIYEALNKAFVLQGAVIAEPELKKMITDALNEALNQGTVSELEFIEFNTG